MRKASLCIIIKEDKILLAKKKRGFGIGKWNGPCGKFKDEDKEIRNTAIRETEEEIGIKIKNPEEVGVLNFRFPHKEAWNQDVHVFYRQRLGGKNRGVRRDAS